MSTTHAVRSGIESSDFESFFRHHYQGLARWSGLLLGDRSGGEEAAQEAFTQVFLRWTSFDDSDHALRYLYKVALNEARQVRRRLRTLTKVVPLLSAPVQRSEGDDVGQRIDVIRALQKLTLRQRTCVLLIDYAGFSGSQAAAASGLTAGAVRINAHRGRERLRELLGDNGG